MMKYPIKEEAKIWSCCRDENMLKSVLYYLKTINAGDVNLKIFGIAKFLHLLLRQDNIIEW